MKKAFSLIELSMVLLIIGILIASVIKGGDLIKSAKNKEFSQTFVNQWELIYSSYFETMNANLADSTANGGSASSVDGFSDGDIDLESEYLNVKNALANAGIDICRKLKSTIRDGSSFCSSGYNPFKKEVNGEFTGIEIVSVTFTNYIINGDTKNIILFNNIPGDVALIIDTLRDGSSDGRYGNTLGLSSEASAGSSPTFVNWDVNTTGSLAIVLP